MAEVNEVGLLPALVSRLPLRWLPSVERPMRWRFQFIQEA